MDRRVLEPREDEYVELLPDEPEGVRRGAGGSSSSCFRREEDFRSDLEDLEEGMIIVVVVCGSNRCGHFSSSDLDGR